MSPDIMTIPAAGQDLYGKTVGDMLGADVKISADGAVTGTLKHVTGYTGFNDTDAAEQEGYFFPLTLEKKGTTMSFYKNGTLTKENIPWEANNAFRVSADDVFRVDVDGEKTLELSFKEATFAPPETEETAETASETKEIKRRNRK